MLLKRLLIVIPAIFIALLAQSYFWVPTYESQTTGNPARVWKFIEASIGDAKILNPALNADSASSRIAGLVFDGLLDYDENLNLRGRLATDWEVSEEAYLLIDSTSRFQDGVVVSGANLLSRLRYAISEGILMHLSDSVIDLELLRAERRHEKIEVADEQGKTITLDVQVDVPPRIKFSLSKVDQDFFSRLEPVIGSRYGDGINVDALVTVQPTDMRSLLQPKLPTLLPIFEHNPIIDFRLRPGVLFHDGHEFDGNDVRFTYESIMDPKNLSPRTSDFEPIKQLEVIDPLRIRVTYRRLFSPAINAWTMGILPEHLLDADALEREVNERNPSAAARESFSLRASRFNRNPVGTGAFRFVEWQSDELIHLQRNETYWEGPPLYHDFYYRVIPDPLTQEVEFLTGAIDTFSPQPHQIARYRANDAFQAFSSLGSGYTYIGFNNRRKLFSDPQVRRALSMAVNLDEIIQYLLYGEAERTTGPYPKNTEWYNHAVAAVPYDPAGALQILEELGWSPNEDGWLEKDGEVFEFNLITNNGNLIRKAIMTTAQSSWRKIGVKCNTQLFEWAVFLEDFVNPGDFDAVVLGWVMGVDPDLFQIWHSSQAGRAQLNFVGYDNPEADKLIVRIRQEYDRNVQRELSHELHSIIAADQPYTFLFTSRVTQVLDRKIVMVEDDGEPARLRATSTGNLFYHFNRWRKLEHAPEF